MTVMGEMIHDETCIIIIPADLSGDWAQGSVLGALTACDRRHPFTRQVMRRRSRPSNGVFRGPLDFTTVASCSAVTRFTRRSARPVMVYGSCIIVTLESLAARNSAPKRKSRRSLLRLRYRMVQTRTVRCLIGPGKPSDAFRLTISEHAEAARAANNGAYPPDLSLSWPRRASAGLTIFMRS